MAALISKSAETANKERIWPRTLKEVAAFDDMVCHFVGAESDLVVCAELRREGRHDAPIGRERLVNGELKFLVKVKSKVLPRNITADAERGSRLVLSGTELLGMNRRRSN
jgi:hypothetical protein